MVALKVFQPKTKIVLWLQDLYAEGYKEAFGGGGIIYKLLNFIESYVLNSAHHVVVIHPSFQRVVVEQFNLDDRKVTVIRNWSQFANTTTETIQETRARHGWSSKKVVVHAGNMGTKQGLDGLLRVSKDFSPEWQLVLVGNGSQKDQLKTLSEQLVLPNLEFIETVSESELANILNAADILLVHEQPGVKSFALPSKLTTYFKVAKPVLVVSEFDSVSTNEVNNSGAGLSAQVGNKEEIVDTLKYMLVNPRVRKQLAANARNYFSEVLLEDVAFQKFETLIQKQFET
jgi:glycosyltransferase involved in cell wall biosynthesis